VPGIILGAADWYLEKTGHGAKEWLGNAVCSAWPEIFKPRPGVSSNFLCMGSIKPQKMITEVGGGIPKWATSLWKAVVRGGFRSTRPVVCWLPEEIDPRPPMDFDSVGGKRNDEDRFDAWIRVVWWWLE